MSSHEPRCPDCKEPMELGFVLDRGHANSKKISVWVSGTYQPSFWTGVKNFAERDKREVESYRCTRCGLLRSYANTKATRRV